MNRRQPKQEVKEKPNLWNQILAEANQDRIAKSNLILLGNRNSGKRTLVKNLQNYAYELAESNTSGLFSFPKAW